MTIAKTVVACSAALLVGILIACSGAPSTVAPSSAPASGNTSSQPPGPGGTGSVTDGAPQADTKSEAPSVDSRIDQELLTRLRAAGGLQQLSEPYSVGQIGSGGSRGIQIIGAGPAGGTLGSIDLGGGADQKVSLRNFAMATGVSGQTVSIKGIPVRVVRSASYTNVLGGAEAAVVIEPFDYEPYAAVLTKERDQRQQEQEAAERERQAQLEAERRAKAESPEGRAKAAAAKLTQAKALLSKTKTKSMERLREIVEEFPETEAAKEAQKLLDKN
jgi:hypothetical protein